MNRRQALLSRRVVRFCKAPSFVAIKDTIPEDTPLDTTSIMKAEGPSLIDLTGYPDQPEHHSRPSRYHQRRLGRYRAVGTRAREASEKHIDLTYQGETLDDSNTRESGIIAEATLSPNAMMLHRRAAVSGKQEKPRTSPKLSYAYRHQSPNPVDTMELAPREERVETNEDRGKGRDKREENHHTANSTRRAWKRLFIDKSAMESTQTEVSSKEPNQDFLSAFSYEFKKPRKDKGDDHSDIIVLDDILPSRQPSTQLTVASPYHETFLSTTKEALTPIATIAPEVRRADMTHATHLHLQKQAARIDSIRQRAKELQKQRRMRPTPEWRPEPLIDFASQNFQGLKNTANEQQHSSLSSTGRKALMFRKTRKANEEDLVHHKELKPAQNIECQDSEEVLRGDSKDAIVELESMVSHESENKALKLEGTDRASIDCSIADGDAVDESSKQASFQPKDIEKESGVRTFDSARRDTLVAEVPNLELPTHTNQSAPHGDNNSPSSLLMEGETKPAAKNLTINTNLSQEYETESDFIDASKIQGGDKCINLTCHYVSPVSDTDASQARIVSPNSLRDTDTLSQVQLELNYSLSGIEDHALPPKNEKYQSDHQLEFCHYESREPEQFQHERNEGSTSTLGRECQSLEEIGQDTCGNKNNNINESIAPEMRYDDLDLPLCLTESTRHGLDAIDADNSVTGSGNLTPQISISYTQNGSPRNKTDDLQIDEQSYSSWSIKPKVSFPTNVDAFEKPSDNFSTGNEVNEPGVGTIASDLEQDIGDIQEVNTNDLMKIMEEATSIIAPDNNFYHRDNNEKETNHAPQLHPATVFREGSSDNEDPQLPTHDQVRRSRFTTPIISPKSTKSTDTSTSGDNAVQSDFYREGNVRESFDSFEYIESYQNCAAPPLVYHLLDRSCIWLESFHCFFCFQAPLFPRSKKRGKKSKVHGLGNSLQTKKIHRPSSPRSGCSVSSRRRSQHRTRSSDDRSKRSARSSPKSTKERRSQRSRGESHVQFLGKLMDDQQQSVDMKL